MDTKTNILKVLKEEHENPTTSLEFPQPEQEAEKIYQSLLKKLHEEISKPEYQEKIDEEIIALLHSDVIQTQARVLTHPPRTFDILEQAKNNIDTYLVHGGDLIEAVKVAVAKEIETDPQKRGYKDKTEAEQRILLSTPFVETITEKVILGTHISQLFMGIPYAPNAITIEDVRNAKAYVNS